MRASPTPSRKSSPPRRGRPPGASTLRLRHEAASDDRRTTVGDLKLFRLDQGKASELVGAAMALEKSLQTLIEHNMETLFGVRFLASEYSTGIKHGGRMDSLGIDENVITQGLFYLDWLMDHRGDFEMLVWKRLDKSVAVDWSNPRLVCVAGDFTKYDQYAVGQMNRSIELVRYRSYDEQLLALELVASTTASAT